MEQKNMQPGVSQGLTDSMPQSNMHTPFYRRKLFRYGLIASALMFISVLVACITYIYYLIPRTPDITYLSQVKVAEPSVIVSADGTELTAFRQIQQEWIALDKISPYVVKALVATEDHRFYEHHGVDIGRTLAAMFYTARGDTQGGSTITQQLARNLFPEEIGRSRSLERKLKEIITAIRIERRYSKEQILETYLNTVPFLYNAFGIEMAARTYFNRSAMEVDVLESATLVGMLKGTHYYNPVVNPERAQARRNVVLAQMTKFKHLSGTQYAILREQPLQIRFNRQTDLSRPTIHFAEHVRRWAIAWAERNGYDLYKDGLTIHTTLDDTLQKAATQAVTKQSQLLQHVADVEWGRKSDSVLAHSTSAYSKLHKQTKPFAYFWESQADLLDAFVRETAAYRKAVEAGETDTAALNRLKQDREFIERLQKNKTRLEAGFVAIDPNSGEVKAWVGSRDFKKDQFDHVAQAQRQPGSTFKPIVYGAALEMGFAPTRSYRDNVITIQAPDGDLWRPTDMGGATGRSMSMREGLVHSKNTITAQVMQDVGLEQVVSLAQAIGVNQSKLVPVPSLALGTSPVTLLEMVSAYTTIADAGQFKQPVFVRHITDRKGKVIAAFANRPQRALSENTALELIDMMRSVVNRGTGQAVKSKFRISADIAGKTGTTQKNTDGWFIMMHPNLVAGSWIGFNDARVTMRSDHWGQGGHNALLVVGDFFRTAQEKKLIDTKAKFPKPQRMPLLVQNRPGNGANRSAASDGDEFDRDIIVKQENDGTTFIGDTQGAQINGVTNGRRTRSPEELARIIRSLGREPKFNTAENADQSKEIASTREQQTSSGSSAPLRTDSSSTSPVESLR